MTIAPADAPATSSQAQSPWLVFQIADQHYAVPLSEVSEVLRDGPVTPVPGAAPDLLGIRHLRGGIVPVMDGRRRLGLVDFPPSDPSQVRLVVLSCGPYRVGLRVDAVGDLLTVNEAENNESLPQPMKVVDDPINAVLAWQGEFVSRLDVGKLVRLRKSS